MFQRSHNKILLLFILALTACAPKMVWNKPGATEQDFAKDKYDCEKDVRQSGYYGEGLYGAMNMQEFFSECMIAHGYTKQIQNNAKKEKSEKIKAEAKAALTECRQKRLDGILKTYVESADCSNERLSKIWQQAGLTEEQLQVLQSLGEKREKVAERLDNKEITEAEANVEMKKYIAEAKSQRHDNLDF